MAHADDQDMRHKLSEMDHRTLKRRRRAVMWTFAPTVLVAAILIAFLFLVRDRQRKLDEKQQAIAEMEQKKKQLDEEISKSTQEVEQKKKEIAELATEQQELADYSNKLRDLLPKKEGILEEKGKIPGKFKTALQPRAKVTSRSGRRHADLYDVDLWLDVPPGSENAIESVTYDLDAAYYKNNHFASEPGAPRAPVSFTVLGCDSKVLITVTLKEPEGSLTIDFDWCRIPGWANKKSFDVPVRIDRKGTPPVPAIGNDGLTHQSAAPQPAPPVEASASEPLVAGRPFVTPRQNLEPPRDPPNLQMPPKK
jgi:uncharacterized membrane-anchored protein YhcB (DUF1043 family)